MPATATAAADSWTRSTTSPAAASRASKTKTASTRVRPFFARPPACKQLTPHSAVDLVQEKVLGQGDQSNESAAEQAKDEAISDFIRDKYKETTGNDFFIADKDKKLGS